MPIIFPVFSVFKKLFMGEVLFYSLGRRLCVGHYRPTFISIRVTWFINGGQLAHPTRYEINPTPALPLEGEGAKASSAQAPQISLIQCLRHANPSLAEWRWDFGVDWAGRPIEPGRAMDGPSWRPAKSPPEGGYFAQQNQQAGWPFFWLLSLAHKKSDPPEARCLAFVLSR